MIYKLNKTLTFPTGMTQIDISEINLDENLLTPQDELEIEMDFVKFEMGLGGFKYPLVTRKISTPWIRLTLKKLLQKQYPQVQFTDNDINMMHFSDFKNIVFLFECGYLTKVGEIEMMMTENNISLAEKFGVKIDETGTN